MPGSAPAPLTRDGIDLTRAAAGADVADNAGGVAVTVHTRATHDAVLGPPRAAVFPTGPGRAAIC